MKYILVLISLFTPLACADVYKSVTSDGEVIFTDVPTQGAKRVHLPELTTYKSTPVPAESGTQEAAPAAAATSYNSFKVDTPEDQATIWDNEGIVNMTVSLEPALLVTSGHKVQFFVDGKPYGKADLSLANTYRSLDRGTHTLSAAVVDEQGTALISTKPVTVFLHQASLLHPNNPLYKP
jgi:Domain of unknown function (DUF4124)